MSTVEQLENARLAYIHRRLRKRTGDDKIQTQLEYIRDFAMKADPSGAFKASFDKFTCSATAEEYIFSTLMKFVPSNKKMADERREHIWGSIRKNLSEAVNKPQFNPPWTCEYGADIEIVQAAHAQETVAENAADNSVKEMFTAVGLDADVHFQHIFDRDDQIKIIRSAIVTAVETDFHNRYHCVLHGKPGCGKTETLMSFGNMLGEEDTAWTRIDATSTTEAGIMRKIQDCAMIPPVLVIEEIEKANESSLRYLLGLMDTRGEMKRITYRKQQHVHAPMLVLATANNMTTFKAMMTGALASRFSHEIYFPEPSEAILRKILYREVEKTNGKYEWIEPTIKFCSKHKITDPRKVVPICLCGRDDLLDDSYQQSLLNVMAPPDEA